MSNASLEKFLANPPLRTQEARRIWAGIGPNPFEKPPQIQATTPLAGLPMASGRPLLPIAWLRHEPEELPFAIPKFREFRSSGTTSNERSRSGFSEDGLLLYKLAALKTFKWVMDQVAPGVRRVVSLIPPTEEWPDSSLAQMVAWIAQYWDVTYATSTRLGQAVSRQPMILMGTGFHFVEAYDQGHLPILSEDCVIFETGGTKGRTRSVTREQLYQMLCEGFGVTDSQIVSEYGMCELASQAYDWFCPGQSRQFRFPGWCEVFVRTLHDCLEESGRGALCVFDPMRIDMPAVFATEDVAELGATGFNLMGRLNFAPLKGCSLNVEQIAPTLSPTSSVPPIGSFRWNQPPPPLERRFAYLKQLMLAPHWPEVLSKETGSLPDAEWLWQNWNQSWRELQSPQALLAQLSRKSNWLVISPRSHSFAALYPVLIGFLAGYKLVVRAGKSTPLLNSICERLDNVELAPDSAVIGPEFAHGYDGVICYGETATIERLTQFANIPVQGFGSGLALAYVEQKDVESRSSEIVHDAFALGQRGCRNIRGLLVAGDPAEFKQICDRLSAAFRDYWQQQFTVEQTSHLSQAMLSLTAQGRPQLRFDADSPLFRHVTKLSPSTIINVPFSLSIQFVANQAEADSLLRSFPEVNLISSDKLFNLPNIETCPLGQVHCTKIDGTWQGQRLFDPKLFG